MYKAEELILITSFRNWADGSLSEEEGGEWNRWVQYSERNRQEARLALEMITGFAIDDPELPDIDGEWNQIRSRLQQSRKSKLINQHILTGGHDLKWFFRIAAILLVVFLISWFVVPDYIPEESTVSEEIAVETITTHFGEKKTITLSDGSEIVLGAGSSLTYAKNWLSKPTKRITLEGEALFTIAKASEKTQPSYVVETEDGSVSVWGTRFTVSTYNEGTRIVLEEGEVRVDIAGFDEKIEHTTMVPGELANFVRAEREITIEKVNPIVYTSWASDKLVFDNTPISHLIERIRRTYDVSIEIKDEQVLNKKLSGSVNFKDLDSLIRAVSEVLKINISREERTVYIYGNNTSN